MLHLIMGTNERAPHCELHAQHRVIFLHSEVLLAGCRLDIRWPLLGFASHSEE